MRLMPMIIPKSSGSTPMPLATGRRTGTQDKDQQGVPRNRQDGLGNLLGDLFGRQKIGKDPGHTGNQHDEGRHQSASQEDGSEVFQLELPEHEHPDNQGIENSHRGGFGRRQQGQEGVLESGEELLTPDRLRPHLISPSPGNHVGDRHQAESDEAPPGETRPGTGRRWITEVPVVILNMDQRPLERIRPSGVYPRTRSECTPEPGCPGQMPFSTYRFLTALGRTNNASECRAGRVLLCPCPLPNRGRG